MGSEILLGALVSILVQGVKKYLGTSTLWTYLALLLISVVGGSAYHYFAISTLWEGISEALIYSAAFYSLIIRRFEE